MLLFWWGWKSKLFVFQDLCLALAQGSLLALIRNYMWYLCRTEPKCILGQPKYKTSALNPELYLWPHDIFNLLYFFWGILNSAQEALGSFP